MTPPTEVAAECVRTYTPASWAICNAVQDGSLVRYLTVLMIAGVIAAAVALLVTVAILVQVRRAQARLGRDGTGMSPREMSVAASRIRQLRGFTLDGLCATAGALIAVGLAAAMRSVL
ncbi:putative protein OS=Tsukamurella paurometabola (strain ATCC 8368 / DSM / CCUG 35730 /CIP 100753 / JCM 10117 / KCTC 9821 / NBRC 16120 / NCIMB 702349/ NCTC 13040) OX=521096 GN=Tpau_0259 PE=4 SV=1 [Tsukamurella paurometabola]|uniref:Uncharacterized protein n=1 Tax=Tsukamurella paurometabola (strain ATCC 8368 / DSM 20162 / CCUG 35730 / CIP 100753 / JCM 10117 / KCTC 9821 / NBRC 16120 / NCIMB 702349 / NCTC 13040) TaxID=521096 RepID=D5UQS6_TSUPD|nr:hypothetical protein [Tsukamurella paurometabola]ADG76909.1 hypothetical protein Tpau_0259 [Tsukamurella paurometabola DSM 20162]SUP42164.1 Uncharacterised protein [Tsukamurella paurometabola]